MAIKVCQLHLYRTAALHLCYQFSDLHLCYYLCKIKYSHAASYMIVKIAQNIGLQGNMSCSILRSLYSYQLHHTAYYYMFKHVIAFLVTPIFKILVRALLDGQALDPVPVLSGVPQGSVLGPVLFLIFINDLPDNIRSSVRLFADDCVLYRNIKSPIDCQILQDDLNSLSKWETDWQMKFNVAKCHSMRVTRHLPDKHILFDYTLHQQKLEQVQSAKYLGITITDNF